MKKNFVKIPFVKSLLPQAEMLAGSRAESLFDARALLLPWKDVSKRVFDVLLSGPVFFLLLPLMLFIALLVKLDSRGPALYAQRRVGLNRRKARCRRGTERCTCGPESAKSCGRREADSFGAPFHV